MLDLSTYFTDDVDDREYNVLEPPLGLLALLSYVNREMEGEVISKACKSRIDFDNFEDFKTLLEDFKPDMVGIRAMTFYKGFFHDTAAYIRSLGLDIPIVVGGPYPTASYNEVLQDKNIDLVAIAEGEETIVDLLRATIANGKKLPGDDVLRKIPGLAFLDKNIDNVEEPVAKSA